MVDENELNIDWTDWDNKAKLKKALSYTNTMAMAQTMERMVEIIHATREAQSQTNQTMNMIMKQLDDLQQEIYMMKINKMGTGPTE